MQQQPYSLSAKIKYLPLGVIIALLIIFARLYHLQINQNTLLFNQSEKNYTRIEKIQSPRGNIVDCSGTLLATNRPLTNVYWQGRGNHTLSDEQLQILQKISAIIDKPLTNDAMFMETITHAERKHKKIVLASDLTFEQLSKIQEQLSSRQNIIVTTHFKRYYPYKSFACHVLGYLGNINLEPEGKMGLEKMFEDILKGEEGTSIKKINSVGKNLDEIQLKQALAGDTIKTTIDIDMQDIVEQIFPENLSGTMIVMDPEDGSIVSLVSRPNFDPNIFLDPINPAQWQTLQEKQPFINRAFTSCYPPGSIFKLVATCAALEHNVIQPDSSLFCNGFITFADRRYWCSRKHGHGHLTTSQALAQSCNILFYDIGKKMSIDSIAEYAHKFGFGEKTNICFPEKEGLVPCSTWKKETKGERWWPGETLSAAIGQSYLLVTPVQVACMISSIFTGYLPKPRILADEETCQRPLDIKESTLEFLRESMRSVVTQGTGIRVNRVKDIEIYAKTSTAQICALGKSALQEYLEHGWFVAYFKYKDNKPLTIVILAENVGSSRTSTNIAKNFLVEYKKLMDSRIQEVVSA